MKAYVIDASVAVEYLLRTELGEAIASVLTHSRLYAPEIFDIEVLAGLRRVVLSGELPRERASTLIDELDEWDFERVSHRGLLAATWRYHQNITAYDSIYLATAMYLGVGVLTADSKLTRAPGLDVAVHDVRDAAVLADLEANLAG